MPQLIRQNKLFSAESYDVVYESYTHADMKSYDYDTIRASMVAYISNNYPEDYNDWVESSEFVALLDVIAMFGHNLAYRIELNSRNNFLSTAVRQDAIHKLSEFLGYKPRRNTTSEGKLKIISIRTNESIIGNDGLSLAGQEILFEDTTNSGNIDNFISVINATLSRLTQFGSPHKQNIINGSTVQFYNMNNVSGQNTIGISGMVLGQSESFEILNVDYDSDNNSIIEKIPNPESQFSLVYANDGAGVTSNGTGFFVGVKQGTLQYKDFVVTNPKDSMSLDIPSININNTDVWVQTVDNQGSILKTWTPAASTTGSSAVYNTLGKGLRDIYAIQTLKNNSISIVFPDGEFGNLPSGNIRVWFRTSLNGSYNLRPSDIGTTTVTIDYIGRDNNVYTATLKVQLRESIINSSSSESLLEIKKNAPLVYATQDRMITAKDYNVFLATKSSNVLKIKSVNRTHSGHSRYNKFNDPTGTYSNLQLFGRDGTLSKENRVKKSFVSKMNPSKLIRKYISPILSDSEVLNFYYSTTVPTPISEEIRWRDSCIVANSVELISTGAFFNIDNEVIATGIETSILSNIRVGSFIKFNNNGDIYWASVGKIYKDGLGIDDSLGDPTGCTPTGHGAVSIDRDIPADSTVVAIYPPFPRQFTSTTVSDLVAALNLKQTFNLTYDKDSAAWSINYDVDTNPEDTNNYPDPLTNLDWMIYVEYDTSTDGHTVYYRTIRYEFGSDKTFFSNITNEYRLDEDTNKKKRDTIDILTGDTSQTLFVYGHPLDQTGTTIDHKVIVVLGDYNNDNRTDNPEMFDDIFGYASALSDLRFEWEHVPYTNELIDPSFTNIIDVFMLTTDYDGEYRNYMADSTGTIIEPLPPTISELNQQFNQVSDKKAMSDKIIYRPVIYRPLFGPKAKEELQAKVKVVKIKNSNVTDSELKFKIVEAVQEFFLLDNWDFGETFYFTEMASYIHSQLPGMVGSIVIVPQSSGSIFGDLFQVSLNDDEIFISDLDANDIDIVEDMYQETIYTK